MTIYEIKERTKVTCPYFFSRKTMQFFGQTLKSYSVKKLEEGKYLITAPMIDRSTGRKMGVTERIFNAQTNDLETIND